MWFCLRPPCSEEAGVSSRLCVTPGILVAGLGISCPWCGQPRRRPRLGRVTWQCRGLVSVVATVSAWSLHQPVSSVQEQRPASAWAGVQHSPAIILCLILIPWYKYSCPRFYFGSLRRCYSLNISMSRLSVQIG